MDFQQMLDDRIAAMRAEQLKKMPVLTVGELIAKIEACGEQNKYGEDKYVQFDFEYTHPTYLMSWRGVYAELAFGYESEGDFPSVAKVLEQLRRAVGKKYEGYKGGDFTMGRSTPVWVANNGNVGNTGIVDVLDEDYKIVLETRYIP